MLQKILNFFYLCPRRKYLELVNFNHIIVRDNDRLTKERLKLLLELDRVRNENKRLKKELKGCIKLRRCYVKKKA